ncbi:M23 family metallopeptidase [Aquihabitans sp. G128]|uniref:murein hydrolase activator EnvC family protein n=1 Tax=Aquihabitans sp. G128 TaxID=2849779 RepID=UPI001C22AB6D|nr:M23 family metallopeptidase [Aquihabitans sp. G128]QXC62610.1 M23 family metallopeptidase [Aquihabitans sp. G128]
MTGLLHRVAALALSVATALAPGHPAAPGAPAAPTTACAARSGPPGPRTYRPPLAAPVRDPFRPPAQPWLPGNRGLAYASAPGSLVRAIGPGVVAFAGPVAGTLHVTVRHPDGLRSSYSFLAAVRAVVGERVAAGQVVGVAGTEVHLGVRRGDAYLDPASLWGCTVGGGHVHLVPAGGGRGG